MANFNFTFGHIFLLLIWTLTLYKIINLYRRIREAKQTGLPYVVVPLLETEALSKFLTPVLRAYYHDYLLKGLGWPHWCRFIIRDWSWEDKRRAHDEYGEVFLVVSPEGIICYSSDAIMGWDVMNRRTEFTKPPDKYKMLEAFGPNVVTAEGREYSFHVRITAPPFSDQNGANDLVWNETAHQTRLLAEAWTRDKTRELQIDVNALTLAVISLTGFGRRVDWTSQNPENAKPPAGYKITFLKAIHDTTGYIIVILLFPRWFLNLTPWREAAVAHQQLESYMRELVRSEKAAISLNSDHQSSTAKGNLLTSLLKVSAAEGAAPSTDPHTKKQAFTEDEVMGNLFLYLLAGYETTANAILYALIVLALRPDIQATIRAEIEAVYADARAQDREDLTYASDFEKFKYTYGFMYETFRLYPGGIIVTKMINQATSIIVCSTSDPSEPPQKYILPKECRVYLSAPAVHYTERYWPNPTVLDPSRWYDAITAPGKEDSTASGKKVVAADKTRQVRGSLLTFSGGGRACLGRKFAQSEFVSFLVTLLKDHEIILGEGMDKQKVQRDLDLRSAGRLTLCPLDSIKLGLKRREK